MATKKYDLAVKTGSYTNRNGETKNRYENIGAVMVGDNGPYLMLKRTFNPAGVPVQDGRDSILVSCFEPRERDQQPQRSSSGQRHEPAGGDGFSSDIPF